MPGTRPCGASRAIVVVMIFAAGSGGDGLPGGTVAAPVNVSEHHVGEVDAEADRVGFGQFGNEAMAEVGGQVRVVIGRG